MLFAIHKGNVVGYSGGQDSIVYLVSNLRRVTESNLRWCFTDRHAVLDLANYFNDARALPQVDWNTMTAVYWNNTQDDPDRIERRQAEFLVYKSFPWNGIAEIGVWGSAKKKQVEAVLNNAQHRPYVNIRKAWYFQS
jgi:hypothetical protein